MSTYNPFGGTTYNLNSSISSTQTSLTLTSFLEPVTGTPYTMDLLNTGIVYATISPKTTSSEFISFTTITQNGDGTATIGGIVRGLAKKYPFTSDSDYKLPHSGQSQFIISDAPQVFKEYGTLSNDEVITGYWEAPNPITNQGLVTNAYMLALINGGPITLNALIETGIAGEIVSTGDLLYFSETDNEWLKTDADTLATVFNVKLGIAQGAGVNGGAIANGVLTRGSYTTSGLTQGDLVYASNTAGAWNSGTSGTTPRVIGIAKSTTVLYFDPDFQNKLYDYAVDAVGTDSYAVTLSGAFSAYYPGMEINFKAGTANTGACTLAINGLAAKSIKKNVSSDLSTGDILANQIITVVYDGTNFQLINKTIVNASTEVIGVLPIANMAMLAFQQFIPYPSITTDSILGVGSNADGSVMIVYNDADTLTRYSRDTLTGAYFETHSVSTTGTSTSTGVHGITVVGNFVYMGWDGGTNVVVQRYALADLTSETSMTFGTPIASSDSSGKVTLWNDGTSIYVNTAGTGAATVHIETISGTALTESGTATATAAVQNTNLASFYDGTSAYLIKGSTSSVDIVKLTNINGSASSTTTYNLSAYGTTGSSNSGLPFGISIDTSRMYIGRVQLNFNATVATNGCLVINPVTKP